MSDIVWRLAGPFRAEPAALRVMDEAADEIERLRALLDLYREAVRIDATMEGPRFMGSNASALRRAWDADLAALEGK